MTGSARAAILARIREALGPAFDDVAADYARITREYRQGGHVSDSAEAVDIIENIDSSRAADSVASGFSRKSTATFDEPARVELFVNRLQHYDVSVFRCDAATLPRAIADTLALRQKTSLLVPADLPREWLPGGREFIADADLSYAELDRSEGVLTACSVAIASTGTIVLRHTRGEGRRALTLVPDYHLCIVRRDQIVETVPEAIRQLAEWKSELVTTISGPSATADIEMTRIRGVHGPRTLDVILTEVS